MRGWASPGPSDRQTPQYRVNWGHRRANLLLSLNAPWLWGNVVSPFPGVSPSSYPLPLDVISQFKKHSLGMVAVPFTSSPSSAACVHPTQCWGPLAGSRPSTAAGTVGGPGTGVSHTRVNKDSSFHGEEKAKTTFI